jgi:plasmid replication initiation protein
MSTKNELVVQSNRLVEASYRLTLIEQQIILFAICRAREEQLGLSADTLVTISAKDFSAMFGAGEKVVYDQLKEAIKTLFSRYVVFSDIHPTTGKTRTTNVRWVQRADYIEGAGSIQLRFSTDMVPYLTRLEKEFTQYRLEKIGKLSSVHAVRLYELLVQYLSLGKREIEIDWLKESLQLSESYPRIETFKRKVIDVSVAQINTHTDITTSYTQRKTGRNVTHLNFKIDAKEAAPTVVKRPSLTRAYVEKHAHPGESWEVARERLRAERARA